MCYLEYQKRAQDYSMQIRHRQFCLQRTGSKELPLSIFFAYLCFKFLIGSEEFGSSRDLGLDFSHLLVGNDPRGRECSAPKIPESQEVHRINLRQDGGWSLKARHPGSDWARIRD